MFGGMVIDESQSHHMNVAMKPTIYIVSHLFSYMDIILALNAIEKHTTKFRKLVGVTNAPPLPQTLTMEILNLLSDKFNMFHTIRATEIHHTYWQQSCDVEMTLLSGNIRTTIIKVYIICYVIPGRD